MMTGQQGIPYEQTLDAAADLAGRLRLVLGEKDVDAAVEVVVAAGWRPAPPDGPIAELVTDDDVRAAWDARTLALLAEAGEAAGMRAALESYVQRLLARHGRSGP